jgi:histidinol-phosphate aminotransferase
MFSFIRADLAQFTAYSAEEVDNSSVVLDRLDANECPFDLPEDLKEKLAFTYQNEISANRYPDGGHLLLKRAIADYVNESGKTNQISANHISVGNGSDELIRSLLIATCLSNQGSILVANPTFSMYGILAKTLGIPVVNVSRSPRNFEININEANTAINNSRNPSIKVVFVVHPNSPTSNPLTSSEIDWLRNLPEHILVVIDEAYFEFSQTTLVSELPQHPNWLILRTFSKAFRLAAHRVGYAIAHPQIAAVLEKVRLPYNLPSFSQIAALTALKHRDLLLAVIPDILAERKKLIKALSAYSSLKVYPSEANFIYVHLANKDEDKLKGIYEQLKQQGTIIRFINGGLRITIGTKEENQRTLQRLKAIL